MSLQQVALAPIARPQYDNRQWSDFARWYTDNQDALADHFRTCGDACGASEGEDDFFLFSVIQHEQQVQS